MTRLLLAAALVAGSFGLGSTASAHPRCPDLVCGERCFDTGEVRFCI